MTDKDNAQLANELLIAETRLKTAQERIASLEYHIREVDSGYAEYLAMSCRSLKERLGQIIRRAVAAAEKGRT